MKIHKDSTKFLVFRESFVHYSRIAIRSSGRIQFRNHAKLWSAPVNHKRMLHQCWKGIDCWGILEDA